MNYLSKYIFRFLSLTAVLLAVGCTKTNPDEIPSYVKIDTISINVNSIQGTASQKIVDSWIYADNELIGGFELPSNPPILKSGSTQLDIFAGIMLNGIKETRVPYPFYQKIRKTVNLVRDSAISFGHMKFAYIEGTKFAWQETFEQANLSIDSTSRSEVNLVRTLLPELATAFPYELNKYAAKVLIPSDSLVFECASHDAFKLPTDGSSVFMELNYKTNNPFTVGLMINGSLTSQRSVLVINPSSVWNKIYINFTPTLSANNAASSFRVFFTATKSTKEANAEIYFDNIKLLHF